MANALLRADAPVGPLTPVEFHGATLSVILINGLPFVALKPICDDLGISWVGQLQRIKRHPVLSSSMCVTHTDAARGNHTLKSEVVMLPLDKLDGWLFGVSVGRVRPELRERLTRYQAECFAALARHFGAAAPHLADHVPSAGNMAPAAPALPAPTSIDVRALLLSGQSEPVPLTPAQQTLIDARAWTLAREAYELSRQHLARRVAHRSRPAHRNDPASTEVADIVAATTLGNALAHEHHTQIDQLLSTARVFKLLAGDTFDALQALVAKQAGQGALVNPLKRDI